ncbi:DUF3313 domain-containing protein [Hyphomicrobium sp.]|uniref:DUF3313 domain-containing protein n=1 Tax=Hyphomicrobium sp. TaxID=82 RepID=UPI002E369641|nr:DUF3313 domain-containing protein [Hyphomicrobium sp.]HEX2841346.1 DUF3313 domain-containing protein [Hyphomicrobium sp.]
MQASPLNHVRLSMLALVMFLPACATAPLVQGFGLSSYDSMKQSDGMLTKSRLHVNKEQVLAAKTIKIVPTVFSSTVSPKLSNEQREVVANAINRSLCVNLSDRFKVVTLHEAADLTVRAAVTQATETDEIAAGVSAAASLGMNFVNVNVPVPVPRVPIGLGNLSIEAEAVNPSGQQQASMLWGRGATAFFSSPKASKASDAYDLAYEFSNDFSELLSKGESPFGDGINLPTLPSWQKINSTMGLAPKYAACEDYGRAPGVVGMVGEQLGLPPEWTDSGAKPAQ